MTEVLSRIAVDLTPVLPGGENGGAKVFVLELIAQLAKAHPKTHWLLLIHARAEEELGSLKKANVELVPVVGQDNRPNFQPLWYRITKWLLPNRASRLGRRILAGLSRFISNGVLWRSRRGRSLLKTLEAQLLFCPFTAPNFWDPEIPLVSTIHDLQYKTYPQFFEASDVLHRDRIFLQAAHRSTLLTAVSNYTRETAIRHGCIEPERIRTIYHRLALRIASPPTDMPDLLVKWGLTEGHFLIYPANFWRHKNHEMLLTGFGMAIRKGLSSNTKLVLTGAPTERQTEMIQAANAMGLGHRVIFPGFISNEALGHLMESSMGMIFPSLYEGFGMPVIEAMAMGVPVASSTSGSLREIAGDAALLFDARKPQQICDAILSMASDWPLRERLIQCGLKRAQEFSDTALMAYEYWNTFEAALIRKGRQHRVIGPYSDGWLGSALTIEVGEVNSPSTLEVVLSSPSGSPLKQSRVNVNLNGGAFKCSRIRPDQRKTLQIPLPAGSSWVELSFGPLFESALLSYQEEARLVTLKLERCRLIRANGLIENLYPPEL